MALQVELSQTQEEWERIHFNLLEDPERGCCILIGLDDLQASFASALLRTQAMRGSAFAKPHAAQLRAWHSKLKRAAVTLSTWATVQDQWKRLAPIFECCEDVAGIMTFEADLFCQV
jgi:hypothetical protein